MDFMIIFLYFPIIIILSMNTNECQFCLNRKPFLKINTNSSHTNFCITMIECSCSLPQCLTSAAISPMQPGGKVDSVSCLKAGRFFDSLNSTVQGGQRSESVIGRKSWSWESVSTQGCFIKKVSCRVVWY